MEHCKTPLTLAEKILAAHSEGEADGTLKIRIDQTLTQDATGTMAYLEFLSMGIPKVRTSLSVSYVDHNTLQSGFENADDHIFLETVANKYGIVFSKAGNGICHQLHLENFSRPGITLLGSDSHTPTSGALAAIAIGAGGLDIALAMAGRPFRLPRPRIVQVRLTGRLRAGVTAKDVILELLRRLSVKGGVNKIFEYTGPGVETLSVPERGTVCNMGAELGATTSIFPSDSRTREFLRMQGREADWKALSADEGAKYAETIEIDLSSLEALAACPSSPDNVRPVRELEAEGVKIDQVLIGSCTNSSYLDMEMVASILKGRKIHNSVSFGINPGSRNVLEMTSGNGMLFDIIQSGARILECTCGPCIGMGQSPCTNAVSVRTYNRNFLGRSGTVSAGVYLVSPVTAAMSALSGHFTDPTGTSENLAKYPKPEEYINDKSMFIQPDYSGDVVMGPNIKPLPRFDALPDTLEARILLKTGDDISTDHIMPAGAKVLPYRSNIERISDFCFMNVKTSFKKEALENAAVGKASVILAGRNYGQGSSREHAAIAPRYLGVRAVLAKSFARIHRQNLANWGILPLEIPDELYESLQEGAALKIDTSALEKNEVRLLTDGGECVIRTSFTAEEVRNLRAGSLLNA